MSADFCNEKAVKKYLVMKSSVGEAENYVMRRAVC